MSNKLCKRCTEASLEVGETVWCILCPRSKAPRGRSAPMSNSYCGPDCEGYYLAPEVGSLWPGETRLDFGYGGVMTDQCTCTDLMASRVQNLNSKDKVELSGIAEEYQDDCCENDATYLLELLAYAHELGRHSR